jgi:putative ATPase
VTSVDTLFEKRMQGPLADRLRPDGIGDVVGQDHLLCSQGAIGQMFAGKHLASIILWGPPGSGKTTIARLLGEHTGLKFSLLSAVSSGVADLRKVFEEAKREREAGRATLLFVDEIHRFNRAQQDGFLSFVEDGTIILIGATTENPSFELNSPLLSRCQVLVLNQLNDNALESLLLRAESETGKELPLQDEARIALRMIANGDGRYLLNMAELLLELPGNELLDTLKLENLIQRRAPIYGRAKDGQFNLISALHKSLRSSDVDASLYWLARIFEGGEDPHYIARRLVRFASEDVGLADPGALTQALAGWDTYDRLGSPEGELAIAQVVLYLASAPKSNAIYSGFRSAMATAKRTGSAMPPKNILNAPTALMKELGFGKDYQYDHDMPDGFSGQNCFPDGMDREKFYRPVERGFEREINKRLAYWEKLRNERNGE